MPHLNAAAIALFVALLAPAFAHAQNRDFPASEFAARRARVMDEIGPGAIALIQGAADAEGFRRFRQTNTMYYLTGIETPATYLVIDGRSRTSTLYMPHEDAGRERGEGNVWAAEDVEVVKAISGVDDVIAVEYMARRLMGSTMLRPPWPTLYTPHAPAETGTDSRDELLRARANHASDPWDVRPTREAAFLGLLRERFPSLEIRDLSPILDAMRSVKSPAEIALIRRASQLAGQGLLEAMRCTRDGRYEYQLESCARFVFQANGSQRDGYSAIVGSGSNAIMGHYSKNDARLDDGELVLMDFAPEIRYYTSDVTRLWPVSGTWSSDHLQLYEFIVAFREALMAEIRPGVTANEILERARVPMQAYVDARTWAKPEYEEAVRRALRSSAHVQHPVGMAVHDVGTFRPGPLQVGHVLTIDPMMSIPSESLYVRVEDTVVVTETGVENFTADIPVLAREIEAIMREPSILDRRPPVPE